MAAIQPMAGLFNIPSSNPGGNASLRLILRYSPRRRDMQQTTVATTTSNMNIAGAKQRQGSVG
jgi:hypothetical protein